MQGQILHGFAFISQQGFEEGRDNLFCVCFKAKRKLALVLIHTAPLTPLTTFCRPSMRLLTTTRNPLSSWNIALSSSQERSHMSASASSAFWPMMLVVMEGLTSTISVLSLTTLASSGHTQMRTRKQIRERRGLLTQNVFHTETKAKSKLFDIPFGSLKKKHQHEDVV